MTRLENPMDPTKDGGNALIDGIRFHIRNSEILVEEIKNFIDENYIPEYGDTAEDVLHKACRILNISTNELTIYNERELLVWIGENYIR